MQSAQNGFSFSPLKKQNATKKWGSKHWLRLPIVLPCHFRGTSPSPSLPSRRRFVATSWPAVKPLRVRGVCDKEKAVVQPRRRPFDMYDYFGSQPMPESSLINLSKYFCIDFSGVVFANSASWRFPSGDIHMFTLSFVAWCLATAFLCASLDMSSPPFPLIIHSSPLSVNLFMKFSKNHLTI